jgi:hypothetical protein
MQTSPAIAQLGRPLQQGDIIITHSSFSPGQYPTYCTNSSNLGTSSFEVSILDAHNTSSIPTTPVFPFTTPNRYTWTQFTPGNSKPNWVHENTWVESSLGRIFGLTIEDANTFYVSNTSIRNGEGSSTHNDAVYKLNPANNTVTQVISFPGTQPNRGIGNIKYFTYGANKYMLVSYWEDGSVRLFFKTGATWNPVAGGMFIPKFDLITPDVNRRLPYGVAIRIKGNNVSILYGKLNLDNNNTQSEVWSRDIVTLAGGTAVLAPEAATFFIQTPPKGIASPIVSQQFDINLFTNTCLNNDVTFLRFGIADISLSQDQNKILLGQQGLCCTQQIAAHDSKVYEYDITTPIPVHISVNMSSGNTMWNTSYQQINGTNSVGGVSYWNNILFRNSIGENGLPPSNLECDATALFTSDAIYIPPASGSVPSQEIIAANNFGTNTSPYVYGFQAIPSRNTFATITDSFNATLKVDADDSFGNYDKFNLGDIEAYNIPMNCTPPCDCGSWNGIGLNNNPQWWTGGTTPVPSLSFNQGAGSGVLIPHYSCSRENCDTSFTYSLTTNTGTSIALSANNGGLDLNQPAINNLPCGSQVFLNIIPKCGGIECPPIRIPITITCFPVCACKNEVTITGNEQNNQVTIQNNISNPNPVSVISGAFTLTSSSPVTEVRMLVDEFRIVTTKGNENCMLCKNKPQNWGSVNTASLSGVATQSSIVPSLNNDIREVIFSNGANTAFPLAGNTLNFSIGLPGVNGLDCCNLQVQMCIKFVIRDTNCCETEILKCFTFDLK